MAKITVKCKFLKYYIEPNRKLQAEMLTLNALQLFMLLTFPVFMQTYK